MPDLGSTRPKIRPKNVFRRTTPPGVYHIAKKAGGAGIRNLDFMQSCRTCKAGTLPTELHPRMICVSDLEANFARKTYHPCYLGKHARWRLSTRARRLRKACEPSRPWESPPKLFSDRDANTFLPLASYTFPFHDTSSQYSTHD